MEIVMVCIWAVLHERPISWACKTENWPEGLWPRKKLPSQPTMSRRLGTTEVQRLLYVMERYLIKLHDQGGLVTVVDGKPLIVGSHSKDPDCKWGRVGHRSFAKGYKLHAIYGSAALPLCWEIAPLNAGESEIAARLLPALQRGGYLLGDKQYDSNPLHETALRLGYQLVAERKRPKTALGHRPHSAGRIRSMTLLQNEVGKALYRCRDAIERYFGWLTNHACGLSPLPNWVRRDHRVRCWVQVKLIIHAIYVYIVHPPSTLANE
jgi:hypothetical protein